jgi:hypothetical protein
MRTPIALLVSSLLLSAAGPASADKGGAAGGTRIAVASAVVDGVTHTAKVKLNASGKIVPWDRSKWALVTPGKGKSIFDYLGQRGEESGFEWERQGRGKNGYSFIRLGTTADEVTFGVSLKDGKGFFNYQDLGSGNGNSRLTLKVVEGK